MIFSKFLNFFTFVKNYVIEIKDYLSDLINRKINGYSKIKKTRSTRVYDSDSRSYDENDENDDDDIYTDTNKSDDEGSIQLASYRDIIERDNEDEEENLLNSRDHRDHRNSIRSYEKSLLRSTSF